MPENDRTSPDGAIEAQRGPGRPPLAAIIEDLERASEGSTELSLRVFLTLYPNSPKGPIEYTTSLDAALTLVPEGWRVLTIAEEAKGQWAATLVSRGTEVVSSGGYCHPTPALALCIAALKGRLSSLQGESVPRDSEQRSSLSDGASPSSEADRSPGPVVERRLAEDEEGRQ